MALTVTNVTPAPNMTDVVLGLPITVTFNEIIDTTTFTGKSFSLTCPGGTSVITPGSLITKVPDTYTNNQYVTGTFSFDNTAGYTIATFVPGTPLTPNTKYTVLVLGADSMLAASSAIKDINGTTLSSTYTWTFTTGESNISTPPSQSPLVGAITTYIQTDDIVISPLTPLTNQNIDLGYQMTITFPAPIDPLSFNMSDVVASLEPILGDPTITWSTSLTATALINPQNPAQIKVIIGDPASMTNTSATYTAEGPTGTKPGNTFALSKVPVDGMLVALFYNSGYLNTSQYTVVGNIITTNFTVNTTDTLTAIYFY